MTLFPTALTSVSATRPRWQWQAWPTVLVFCIAIGVYLNALRNGYAMDDVPLVQNNAYVHGFSHPREIFLGPYWPDPPALYRPLVLLSFATDWAMFGDNPMAFHGVNIVLHALVVAVLHRLLVRLEAPRWGALAGAVIFAVHPVHVEAVANIVGRAELLAALFFLLACHLHLSRALAVPLRLFGTAICYLLALGAKEIAVTLPAVLLLLDLFRDRTGWIPRWQFARRELPLYLTLTAVLAGYMALRVNAIGEATGAGTAPYLQGLSTSQRIATAVRIWPEFARLLFWPQTLSSEWGPALIFPATWAHPLTLVGLVLGAALVAGTVEAWKRARWVSLAALWFAVIILPVSQLLFPVGVILAERTLYLPSIALAMVAPAAAVWAREQRIRDRAAVVALFGLAVVLASWRTWERTPAWESPRAVSRALIWDHPTSFRALWMAAGMLEMQGRHAEAIPLLERAVALTNGRVYHLNMQLAKTMITTGQAERAEPVIRNTIRLSPRDGLAYLFLSQGYLQLGRYEDAVGILRQGNAVARDSAVRWPALTHNMALAHDGAGSLDSALVWRQRSMDPRTGRPLYQEWYHLARLRTRMGQGALAEQALDSARATAPAAVRDSLVLDPLPAPNSRLLSGWRSDTAP